MLGPGLSAPLVASLNPQASLESGSDVKAISWMKQLRFRELG